MPEPIRASSLPLLGLYYVPLLFIAFWADGTSAACPPSSLTLGVLHPGLDPAGWPVGVSVTAGMQVAFQTINEDTNILPGTTLQAMYGNSSCNAGLGLVAAIDMIQAKVPAILGTGCSSVAMAVAPAFKEMKMPMVSYANTHPDLSEKSKYPWYFRATYSDGLAADAAIASMVLLEWTIAATISDQTWFAVTTRFAQKAAENSITVQTQSIVMDAAKTSQSMATLKASRAKIFFTICYADVLSEILKTAVTEGANSLFVENYAWFLPYWIAASITDPVEQLVFNGFLASDPMANTQCIGAKMATEDCTEGTRYSTFINRVRAEHPYLTASQYENIDVNMAGVLDAMDVMANTLDTLFKAGVCPDNTPTFSDQLLAKLKVVGTQNLTGAQVPTIQFDSNHDFTFAAKMQTLQATTTRRGTQITKKTVMNIDTNGKASWVAGGQAAVVYPAYGSATGTTKTTPTSSWPSSSTSATLDTAELTILAVALIGLWALLTIPAAYLLWREKSEAAYDMMSELLPESGLDAMELAAALLIFQSLEGDISDIQMAQIPLISLAVVNIIGLDVYTIWRLRPGNPDFYKVGRIHWFRHWHNTFTIFLILPISILEVALYLDSLDVTDLICVIVLSVDLGFRTKNAVSHMRETQKQGSIYFIEGGDEKLHPVDQVIESCNSDFDDIATKDLRACFDCGVDSADLPTHEVCTREIC